MILEVGDNQFVANFHALHARTGYKDQAPPTPRRHLTRLWLATPESEGDGVCRSIIAIRRNGEVFRSMMRRLLLAWMLLRWIRLKDVVRSIEYWGV